MAGGSKRRLGRGLDGLLPAAPPVAASSVAVPASSARRGNLTIPIEELYPNRKQPRRNFDQSSLEELSQSIREHGILEPVLVRARKEGGFTIVAGERRWRAAQKAGLQDVPVFVRELSDKDAFEAAIVENIQREDLNPIETARAFQRLVDEYEHTQETIATRVGRDRSTVANALRLLKLPSEVLELIEAGQLTEGHGRALLGAPSPSAMRKLAADARRLRWSVREVERRVRDAAGEVKPRAAATSGKSANVRDLERRLTHALGTRVTVEDRSGRGHLAVHYASWDQLDGIIQKLT